MSESFRYMISIIIPVYNVEKYINRAMQSLLDQTIGFDNLQIIFVDDCSTDNSWNIVCEFKEKYKNVFAYRLLKNSGSPGIPRNKGLELAKADYVMFLDPDDEYELNACETLFKEIERDKSLDLVFGYCNYLNEDDKCYEKFGPFCDSKSRIYSVNNDADLSILVTKCVYYFGDRIYKTSVIRENNVLFPELSNYEDVVFSCHYLLKSRKVMYVDTLIYKYFFRENSLSKSINKQSIAAVARACKLIQELFKHNNKDNLFKCLVEEHKILDYFFYLLIKVDFVYHDLIDIKKEYKWLCEYCARERIEIKNEYSTIIFNSILFCGNEIYFDNYKSLRTINRYVFELEKSKRWFLEQISNKDKEIENLNSSNIEFKNWITELQESKEWLTQQINNKDKEIKNLNESTSKLKEWIKELEDSKKWFTEQLNNKDTELKNIKEELDNKNKKLLDIKNYYKQPIYKRLFSKRPNIV